MAFESSNIFQILFATLAFMKLQIGNDWRSCILFTLVILILNFLLILLLGRLGQFLLLFLFWDSYTPSAAHLIAHKTQKPYGTILWHLKNSISILRYGQKHIM